MLWGVGEGDKFNGLCNSGPGLSSRLNISRLSVVINGGGRELAMEMTTRYRVQ
jgi:hypothetical protein